MTLLATIRSNWLTFAAVTGTLAAIGTAVRNGARTAEPTGDVAVDVRPAPVPFADVIAGPGLIESAQRDVRVAAPVSGLVTSVAVSVGDRVQAGAPLFTLDRRQSEADVRTRRAMVASARAALLEQETALAQARLLLTTIEQVDDRRAVSHEEVVTRRSNVQLAEARLSAARAEVSTREAELGAAVTSDGLRIVRAPSAGEVLAVSVRAGEFVMSGGTEVPVRLGGVARLQVRVDIDENDAWRFAAGARARLTLRGNAALGTDLRYEYVERYVTPKVSLTGSATERVDTRVLQVIYSFPSTALPVYVGQQVDVVIEAAPRTGSAK
ncbi:MAG: biotin/lipoyl-binding protein [Gemmatimonadaceae bacterium]|jgi:multidrug efflux pump subunit AcrA (membrane-fusion protein)|nr:biotin/lipoyl-binding protein [Gemmatimonadaceae bacterium]